MTAAPDVLRAAILGGAPVGTVRGSAIAAAGLPRWFFDYYLDDTETAWYATLDPWVVVERTLIGSVLLGAAAPAVPAEAFSHAHYRALWPMLTRWSASGASVTALMARITPAMGGAAWIAELVMVPWLPEASAQHAAHLLICAHHRRTLTALLAQAPATAREWATYATTLASHA